MYAFWGIIASNAIVAMILAIGAVLLGRVWKNAAAIHVLWVVVLLKLFTPPWSPPNCRSRSPSCRPRPAPIRMQRLRARPQAMRRSKPFPLP